MRGHNALLALMLAGLGCGLANAQDQPAPTTLVPEKGGDSQQSKPERFYRLTFRGVSVGEDGTSSVGRVYTEIITTGMESISQMRNGDKVPVANGSGWSYVEVNTNFDTRRRATEVDGSLHIGIVAQVGSLVKPAPNSTPNAPVIRECKWDSDVTVPIGKPTIIFSSDDVGDKGKTELELTATPIR